MKIDWAKFEETVYDTASKCLSEFAALHANEVFYGFFLDCNATYFEILGHLNTEKLLRKKAATSKKQYPDLYKGVSIKKLVEDLRWSGGDWSYFEMFCACGYDNVFDAQIAKLIDNCHKRPGSNSAIYDAFLETACRVAVRLERGTAFDGLRQTEAFRILCVDHDETVEAGEARLQKIRKRFKR